jgi:hypothetical protein
LFLFRCHSLLLLLSKSSIPPTVPSESLGWKYIFSETPTGQVHV